MRSNNQFKQIFKDRNLDNLFAKDAEIINLKVDNITQAKSAETLVDVDLANYAVGPGQEFYYFSTGFNDGDDGVATYNSTEGYLEINSSTFTKLWTPGYPDPIGGLDHVKYLVYQTTPFDLPDDGSEIVYSVTAAGQINPGTVPASIADGVTNAGDDIRLAGCAINCIDYETWMVYDFFLSNETIYAFYERLPFGKPSFGGSGPDYHAYSHAIPIAKRNKEDPLNQYNELSIAINRKNSIVRWLVDGEEKFRIKDIGLPIEREYRILDHDGPSLPAEPEFANFGFGTFTLLDMNNPVYSTLPSAYATQAIQGGTGDDAIAPNKPLVQLGLDPQYIDPQRTDALTGNDLAVGDEPRINGGTFSFLSPIPAPDARLFGNGAILRIKSITVKRFFPLITQTEPAPVATVANNTTNPLIIHP